MSFGTSWDVDQYKSQYKCEEQWQFIRTFLIAHKMKYPEERLLSLAQTFFNIEYLGFKYPQETMELIENLSKGVADDLREELKKKFPTTIESALNVAEERADGNNQTAVQMINDSEPKVNKCISTPFDSNYYLPGFMLLFRNSTEEAVDIIDRSCTFSNLSKPGYKFSRLDPQTMECKLYINNKLIASGSGTSKKKSKKEVVRVAFAILKEKCYSIQEKEYEESDYVDKISIVEDDGLKSLNTPVDSTAGIDDKNTETRLPENNIGNTILKTMGWKQGCGLGKDGQGRLDPIEVVQLPKNLGLGGTNNIEKKCSEKYMSALQTEIKEHVFKFLEDSKKRLTFSTEFSSQERKMIHIFCSRYGLKTRSYGRDENRHVVIFKRQIPRVIFRELIKNDCENEHYILKPPTTENDTC